MVKYDKDADVIIWTYKPNDIIVKNFNAFAYCKKDPISGLVAELEKKRLFQMTL